jgi:preprotein translocase subunit SecF
VAEIKNLGGIEPQIMAALEEHFFTGAAAVRSAEAVSPQIGADLRNRAVYVTLAACAGMLVYVAVRFKSWGYGLGAVVAVFHDVLVTLGIFSIMQWEVDLNLVGALLSLIGFSMNDTIVIFDRVRENLRSMRRESLEQIVNTSVNQTLARTVITAGTTFLSVLSLYLFGGEVLRGFAFTMLVGIISGTYSTIFIASAIAIILSRRRTTTAASAAGRPEARPARPEARPARPEARPGRKTRGARAS